MYTEKHREYMYRYYLKHREKILQRRIQYYHEHKKEIKKYQKQYRQENKEKINQYHNQYNKEHSEKIKQHQKKWYLRHKKEKKQYNKQYAKGHKKEKRQNNRDYYKTENGRLIIKRKLAKRRRNLRYELLFDNIFSGRVVGHHISNGFVFYIPECVHQNNLGNDHRQKLKSYIEKEYNISYIIADG